jgi:spermidine synthase
VRRALAPGGIAVQWAPTPAVTAGFLQVFPHVVLVYPSSILLGSDSPIPFDHLKIQEALRNDPQVRGHFLAAGVQPDDIEAMSSAPPRIWGPDSARPDTRANTDLRPYDEYALPAY